MTPVGGVREEVSNIFCRPQVCSCVLASYPRWMVRMCLWMPAAVLSTLPQFFHRHLNITFMEFCRKHAKVPQLQSENTGAHTRFHVDRKTCGRSAKRATFTVKS